MSFNAKQCIVIRIAHKETITKTKQARQTSYKLYGHTLDNVEAIKYRGLIINNNLSWDRHIDNIFGKGNKTLGFIRRNLKDCTKPIKLAADTAIVRPTVEYASTVWDPSNQTKIKSIEQVHK